MESPVIRLFNFRLTMAIGLCLFGATAIAAGGPPANSGRDCNPMFKPHPECLPLPSTAPASPAQAAQPSRQRSPEHIEKEERWLREQSGKAAAIPPVQMSPEQVARDLQWTKEHAGITLNNNGQTLPATADGSKGSIFLDDEKFPVRSLTLTCKPHNAAAIGEPRYGSRGPDLYPVWIVSVLPGNCVLRNKNFVVNIVIQDIQE